MPYFLDERYLLLYYAIITKYVVVSGGMLFKNTKAGFARNATRLGEARFPSPHADDVRAPRYSRGD